MRDQIQIIRQRATVTSGLPKVRVRNDRQLGMIDSSDRVEELVFHAYNVNPGYPIPLRSEGSGEMAIYSDGGQI